jgi:hypothetical protein
MWLGGEEEIIKHCDEKDILTAAIWKRYDFVK